MTAFLQGAVVAAFLIASNVIAAGVVLALGKGLQFVAPAWYSPWPWLAVCAAGALAAYLFLLGVMRGAARRHLFEFADPNKGLKSLLRQRGG
jgi:hypothetical protein